jgi:ubiquitin-conjugating enzyme E2 O
MVCVRWLDEDGPGAEEEWSAFDLQIDPEFGYRLGDAVIRRRDWEQPSQDDGNSGGPRVGQVISLESGSVRVRWLNGAVSLHNSRELYRVGDEEEGSMAESQEATGEGVWAADAETAEVSAEPAAPADDGDQETSPPSTTVEPHAKKADVGEFDIAEPTEEGKEASSSTSGRDGEVVCDTGCEGADGGQVEETVAASGGNTGGATLVRRPESAGGAAGMEAAGETKLEDMEWETLPSDHHFLHCTHPAGPGSRPFLRRVQREWSILQRGLPRSIWVHLYPDRMELLRACLCGPEGTPYSDALFFFDVHLPPTYPQIPPQVRFWSFGENLNPNLYENGKVCLSLLGTWSGKDSETWSPERSNLLQVLVSILGLVLNTEPYYNEPGFERERDTPQGGLRSQRYNESVALSSYHLMLRVLRSPPSDFDIAVKRHFAERRPAILQRARELREGSDSTCSEGFRKSLAALFPRLEEVLPEEAPP